MSSTFTVNLGAEEPAFNDQINTWGTTVNSNWTLLDQYTGTTSNVSMTSTDVTLTVTTGAFFRFNITGVLTANVSLIFNSAVGGQRIIANGTTGAFTVTIKNGAGDTGVVAPQGITTPVILTAGAAQFFQQNANRLSLLPSVSGNALTITNVNPIIVQVRDSTLTAGDTIPLTLAAGAAFTIPSGATLGATNGVPFRAWIVLFNDGGTSRYGVVNCFNGTTQPIFALSGLSLGLNTTTQLTSSSLNAGVIYTNGAAATSKCFAILGYFEYSSGLTTAGAYASTPKLQLLGPGVPLPGQVVQSVAGLNLAGQTGISSPGFGVVSNSALPAITLTSAANPVKFSFVCAAGVSAVGGVNTSVVGIVSRGGAGGGFGTAITGAAPTASGGTGWQGGFSFVGYDNPPTVGPITYQLQAHTTGAGSACSLVNVSGIAEEIMV